MIAPGRQPVERGSVHIVGNEITKKFPTWIYALVLGIIFLGAIAPLVSVFVASGIAENYGCALDEGGTHPCMIGGTDRGELLNVMFVLGWLMLLTMPAGAIAFLIWLIALVLHRRQWRRRMKAARAA